MNRLTNMIDASGTNKFTYNANGDLLTEDGPFASDTVTYGYSASVPHLRTSLTLQQPTGNWSQTYTNDALRRMRSVTSPAGTFVYNYLGAGGLWTNLAMPNSVSITNRFDTLARLTGTGMLNSGAVVTNSHRYTYNNANQRTSQTVTYLIDIVVCPELGS
jgi:hypothetical protein